MKNTTLVYIERGDELLLMNRNRKKNDLNEGKWVGVGGKFEPGEGPEECMLREVLEETGLIPADWELAGVIDFVSDRWEDERMFLYRVTAFGGSLRDESGEGSLEWVHKDRALELPMWEGDRYFLTPLLEGKTGIRLRVSYDADGRLKSAEGGEGSEAASGSLPVAPIGSAPIPAGPRPLISIDSALLGCEIRKRLYAARDAAYRDFQAKLIPGEHPWSMIGVRTPELRKLAKELMKGTLPGCGETAARVAKNGELSEALLGWLSDLPHALFEENQLHAFVLSEMKDFGLCVELTEGFLPFIDNWATCDQLSPKVFKKHRAELLPRIRAWIASGETYSVRFGIGMLMQHFLDGDFSTEYLELAASVRSDEYYVNMMTAWYFATALAKQWDAALPFIEGRRLERWTHNKAIQKAVESYRITDGQKELLKAMRRRAGQ